MILTRAALILNPGGLMQFLNYFLSSLRGDREAYHRGTRQGELVGGRNWLQYNIEVLYLG